MTIYVERSVDSVGDEQKKCIGIVPVLIGINYIISGNKRKEDCLVTGIYHDVMLALNKMFTLSTFTPLCPYIVIFYSKNFFLKVEFKNSLTGSLWSWQMCPVRINKPIKDYYG